MNIALNLGCGGETRFPDTIDLHWVNVDARDNVGADLVTDCTKSLPYADDSIQKIACVHMLEHLPRLQAPVALKEWFRVLKRGCAIDIEVPNVDLTMKSYLDGNDAMQDKRIENIYGRQFFPGDQHCWGYNFKRLSKLLNQIGFINCKEINEWSYHQKEEPCLRIIAFKP
jgi:predicted SAM-dependent methyltransferase